MDVIGFIETLTTAAETSSPTLSAFWRAGKESALRMTSTLRRE